MTSGRRSARITRFGLTAVFAATLLAACGGGTTQYETFIPDQYVAFGDESSVILADGRRYTVNPLTTDGAIDCATEPIWTQAVANHYGFAFQECNPNNSSATKAEMRAVAGARADDLKTQIDSQIARAGFAPLSLVTILVGANDVLDLYAAYPQQTEEQLTAELADRGVRLGQQVNRLVDLGARVIVATVPDMGLSPYALAEKAKFSDIDRAALLTRLTAAFNSKLRTPILNDGRYIGLVLGDEAVQSVAKYASSYGVTDATSAVCTVALPNCTTQTLVASGTSATWLWADDRHLAYGGQTRLGTLAVSRATGNPF